MLRPENRHFVRRERHVRVTIGAVSAVTNDVGEGGFSMMTTRPLPPGAEVEGSIRVDGRELRFGGKVSWVAPGGPPRATRLVGVRFTRVPWDLQRLLAAP